MAKKINLAKTEAAETTALSYTELKAQFEQSQLALQNAVNIANYFGSKLEGIEQLLLKLPFKNGKFLKTLFWVIANFATIRTIIEDIYTQIQEWRKQLENLRKQSEANQA